MDALPSKTSFKWHVYFLEHHPSEEFTVFGCGVNFFEKSSPLWGSESPGVYFTQHTVA